MSNREAKPFFGDRVSLTTQNSKLKTQNSATDWHCHLLPSLDDGPSTMAESIEMARLLRDAGYETVHCTPHLIKGVYDAGNEAVRSGVGELQTALDREGIELKLHAGREYYLDEFLPHYLQDPLPLGDTQFILVEIPHHAPVELVKETLYRIRQKGYIPLIAHPERCKLFALPLPTKQGVWEWFKVQGSRFQDGDLLDSQTLNVEHRTLNGQSNSLLDYLIDLDCQFQGNLGSFAGYYGDRARASAGRMREMGLYSCFGSDGHNVEGLREILVQGAPSP
ncbi:tyrosine-protein phosphatase [Geobacter sp. AOG1]|uniref:tyrosine-protein phosphatase n=1 Tax=Geobacter sp. AOG1 TaxID=1566346 RepID=UPI001CC6AEC5|nr:CpsB/CapC family capsule biosynthesis tyrosine phosphatase [Geobacter sp. AOG1]GFE58649.1 tyrosine-protein phosphatase YwqE [Geobacter sp. AOG1]